MLRVMGLALLLVVGAAVPAVADEARESRGGIARGASQGGATEVQALLAMPAVAAPSPAVDGTTVALAPERQRRRPWIQLPWLARARSGFAVTLSERFSLGVGYRHVVGEDLWREFADVGSVDYDSHNILLRANWRF